MPAVPIADVLLVERPADIPRRDKAQDRQLAGLGSTSTNGSGCGRTRFPLPQGARNRRPRAAFEIVPTVSS